MSWERTDALVAGCTVLCLAMVVGMVSGIWQLPFFATPLLATLLIALGSLNRHSRWGPTGPLVLGYGIVLFAIFSWVGLTVSDTGTFGGLRTSMGVALYVLWPFVTLTSGLLYAAAYSIWLKHDLADLDRSTDAVDV